MNTNTNNMQQSSFLSQHFKYLAEVMVLFRFLEVKGRPLLVTRSCQQVVKHMVVPTEGKDKRLITVNKTPEDTQAIHVIVVKENENLAATINSLSFQAQFYEAEVFKCLSNHMHCYATIFTYVLLSIVSLS